MRKPAAPPPAAPARKGPAPEPGKVSAAILETLRNIEGQNARILAQLEGAGKKKGRRYVRNMYGERVPAGDEEE